MSDNQDNAMIEANDDVESSNDGVKSFTQDETSNEVNPFTDDSILTNDTKLTTCVEVDALPHDVVTSEVNEVIEPSSISEENSESQSNNDIITTAISIQNIEENEQNCNNANQNFAESEIIDDNRNNVVVNNTNESDEDGNTVDDSDPVKSYIDDNNDKILLQLKNDEISTLKNELILKDNQLASKDIEISKLQDEVRKCNTEIDSLKLQITQLNSEKEAKQGKNTVVNYILLKADNLLIYSSRSSSESCTSKF